MPPDPKVPSRNSRLQDFVDWAAAHITGDEKGEAQIFLDRLFQAFGQKGLLEVGGTAEFHIRKAKEDGGTAFAATTDRSSTIVSDSSTATRTLEMHFAK